MSTMFENSAIEALTEAAASSEPEYKITTLNLDEDITPDLEDHFITTRTVLQILWDNPDEIFTYAQIHRELENRGIIRQYTSTRRLIIRLVDRGIIDFVRIPKNDLAKVVSDIKIADAHDQLGISPSFNEDQMR